MNYPVKLTMPKLPESWHHIRYGYVVDNSGEFWRYIATEDNGQLTFGKIIEGINDSELNELFGSSI